MKRLALVLAIAVLTMGGWRHSVPYPAISVYFSSSTGNDSNPCTMANPCQTITKANTLIYGAGSHLYLLAGDTFTTTTALQFYGPLSGHAANAFGVTVTTYGGGTCNVIAGTISGCATIQMSGGTITYGVLSDTVGNMSFSNLRVLGGSSYLTNYEGSYGFYIYNNSGSLYDVTLNNVEVVDTALEIWVRVVAGSLYNFTLEDSYIHGSTTSAAIDFGLLAQGHFINPLIQGNLFTNQGGHPKSAPGYQSAGSGSGILLSNGGTIPTNGLDQFNVTSNLSLNSNDCGGPAGNWTYGVVNTTVQFNESYNLGPSARPVGACDFDGFDIDAGNVNAVVQYNYAHNNLGPGLNATIGTAFGNNWTNNVARYNIIEAYHTSQTDVGSGVLFAGHTQAYNLKSAFFNNSFATNWDSYSNGVTNGTCLGLDTIQNPPIFANNICYNTGATGGAVMTDVFPGAAAFQTAKNDYFYTASSIGATGNFRWNAVIYSSLAAYQAAAPGQEVGSITADPKLTSAPGGLTCYVSGEPAGPQPCPSGYVLKTGSPAIGVGLNMLTSFGFSNGTRDYYGNSIPNGVGTGYNIGADGGNP